MTKINNIRPSSAARHGKADGSEPPGRGPAGSGTATRRYAQLSPVKVALRLLSLGPLVILGLLVAYFSVTASSFFSVGNFSELLAASMTICVLAIGQLVVVIAGGIDLSQGSGIALATVIGAKVATEHTSNAAVIIALIMAIGIGLGLVNGLIIERLRIGSPFVVTLGTLSMASGLAYVISGGATITGMPHLIVVLGAGYAGQLPVSVFVAVGFALAVWALCRRLQWGRWLFAVGGNRQGAVRVGIPARRVVVGAFVVSGVAIGIASVLNAGYTNSGYATAGVNAELSAISAVVIGGASLHGGRGRVSGAIAGALILGTLQNGLNLLGINPNWEPFVTGAVLILAVGLDQARQHLEDRLRLATAAREQGEQPGSETPQHAAAPVAAPGTLIRLRQPGAPAAAAVPPGTAVLELRDVSKRYGAVSALSNVSLTLHAGEILALLGDNGAGKSTLVKGITGAAPFDSGDVVIGGRPVSIGQPHDSRRLGIEAVYQDLTLFDNLTLADNLFIGRELTTPRGTGSAAILRERQMRRSVSAALDALEVRIKDPSAYVGVMSGGQRQAIAVARSVAFASRIVILDEPTAALGIRETANVMRLIKRLPEEGLSVILISHNLEQVSAVADRAVVLRQGRQVGEAVPSPEYHDRIVSMIVGSAAASAQPSPTDQPAAPHY